MDSVYRNGGFRGIARDESFGGMYSMLPRYDFVPGEPVTNEKMVPMNQTFSSGKTTFGDFGPEYGGWAGDHIEFSTTHDAEGATSADALGLFLDSSNQRLYSVYNGGYRTGGYFGWGTLTSIPSLVGNPRGTTIGYHEGTAYLYIADFYQYIRIYRLSDFVWVGSWALDGWSRGYNIAYDGNGGFYIGKQGTSDLYHIPITDPSDQTITPDLVVTTTKTFSYDLCYNHTSVIMREANSGTAHEIDIETGNVLKSFTTVTTGYGLHIDYENRNLYTGGLLDETLRRFPEVA